MPSFIFFKILNMPFVQVRRAMQRKKEIWRSRRTFFTPSSTIPPSSAASARASHGVTPSVIIIDISHLVLTLNANYSMSAVEHGIVVQICHDV